MKNLLRALALVSAVFCFSIPLHAQETKDRFKTELEPIIQQAMAQAEVPGFAIAVVQNQKIVYAAGFGVRNLTRSDDKITPESLFHMASITKPFVATSVMQLVEQGRIELDAPLVKYLPYFHMKDERYKTITIRQMLTHTSGMPDVEDYEWDKPQYDDGALERYVRSLKPLSLIAAPGTRFQYSNMAYEILGDVIAKVSGQSFEDYVRQHILEPLGMSHSTLFMKQADPQRLTSPHNVNASFDVAVSPVFPYNRMHSPSSTLYSSVLDMTRWAMANMNRGELNGKRMLKASTYDVMWKPAGEQWSQIGISWFLRKYKDHRVIGHGGGDTGFRSNLAMLPDDGIAVVMMSNYDGPSPLSGITNAALDVALGLKPEPLPAFKPTIAKVVYKTMASDGIDAAIKKYQALKQTAPDGYNFAEEQLNALGYRLMTQGKRKEAIRVLQLNAEAFPQSSNVYDSLGEAYMKNGDKELAIKNYEKSLALDARNQNAVEMLKKLKGQ
jgi:CubicO group peptidase (beta-lactamase class C family)